MLFKLLLVIGVIALVYFFFIKKKPLSDSSEVHPKKGKENEEDMVACKTCGTYISLKEALLQNGEYFCSNECMKA